MTKTAGAKGKKAKQQASRAKQRDWETYGTHTSELSKNNKQSKTKKARWSQTGKHLTASHTFPDKTGSESVLARASPSWEWKRRWGGGSRVSVSQTTAVREHERGTERWARSMQGNWVRVQRLPCPRRIDRRGFVLPLRLFQRLLLATESANLSVSARYRKKKCKKKKQQQQKQSKTKCHTGHPLWNGHSPNRYPQACIPLLRSVLTRDSDGEIYRPRIKYEGNLQRWSDLSQMLFHNPAALGTFPQHTISKSCSAWISCLSSWGDIVRLKNVRIQEPTKSFITSTKYFSNSWCFFSEIFYSVCKILFPTPDVIGSLPESS